MVHGFHHTVEGGALAAVCLETLTWAVYHVPIPCQLDHSYAVEVYTLWVLYRVKSMVLDLACVSRATACSLRDGGNFTKSFIVALHSRRPKDLGTGLVDLSLADCVRQAERFPPPQQLYSHQEGTFLDTMLDAVDGVAKTQALQQPLPMPVGYIEGLQPSQPGFSKDGVQWHDASTVQNQCVSSTRHNKKWTMPPRWCLTPFARPTLPLVLSCGADTSAWCRSATVWTRPPLSHVLSVVSESRPPIFRQTANMATCGRPSCIHD